MHPDDTNSALKNFAAIVDFSKLINSNLEIEFIFNNLLLTCLSQFQTSKALLLIKSSDDFLTIHASKGIDKDQLKKFNPVPISKALVDNSLQEYININSLVHFKSIETSEGLIGYLYLGNKFNRSLYNKEDDSFLQTIINISATAIENSFIVQKINHTNRELDSKINQLSSLFDLSKEFSGILELPKIAKLLVFSIIGQLMVTKYCVVISRNNNYELLDSSLDDSSIRDFLHEINFNNITTTLDSSSSILENDILRSLGIELIVPMMMQNKTKGLILLGSRINNLKYTNSDKEFVYALGSLAVISIENSMLFEEAIEKKKLEQDLEIAKNIQSKLLPDAIPKLDNYSIAAYNHPAKQVGGDYYDVVQLEDNRTLVAIGDVSGKGVQAALLMANVQAFLQAICKQNISLDKASNLINDLVSENTTLGSFITFFWGILNKENEFVFVNAGHNPPLLLRDGEIIKLKRGGMVLGVMETQFPYESEKIKLKKDDVIVLFTDGITEAMDLADNDYSDERLENLVTKERFRSAGDILNLLVEDVRTFTKGAEQSDDITCVIIKVEGL